MAHDPLKGLRRKRQAEDRPGLVQVRADLTVPLSFKATEPEKVALAITQDGGPSVLLRIPEANHAEFLTAAFKTLEMLKDPAVGRPDGPQISAASQAVPVDQLTVLEPSTSGGAPGHAVLRIHVGPVPMDFSAPVSAWRTILQGLTEAGVEDGPR